MAKLPPKNKMNQGDPVEQHIRQRLLPHFEYLLHPNDNVDTVIKVLRKVIEEPAQKPAVSNSSPAFSMANRETAEGTA